MGKPIVIERDATAGRPVWRVYVKGTQVASGNGTFTFAKKSDAESVAHMCLRYRLNLGDMLFAHCEYTERGAS